MWCLVTFVLPVVFFSAHSFSWFVINHLTPSSVTESPVSPLDNCYFHSKQPDYTTQSSWAKMSDIVQNQGPFLSVFTQGVIIPDGSSRPAASNLPPLTWAKTWLGTRTGSRLWSTPVWGPSCKFRVCFPLQIIIDWLIKLINVSATFPQTLK